MSEVSRSSIDTLHDLELLELYRARREHPVFVELVRRYQQSAYRFAFARCGDLGLAEDAVQEAFMRLVREDVQLPAQVPFQVWFFGLVSNAVTTVVRSERRRKYREYGQAKENATMTPQALPSEGVDAETRGKIINALGQLDETDRIPLVLQYIEGLSQSQISEMTGVSQS